ncbi:MAG: lipoyl(octanoyl) transferase LipB [Nitrospira sp.]|jgi:lipoyl(octanoyl) transferase|nr:MAG: lipoyl(octanoyl) transferase LipB [Nitrospira sp.]
MGQAFDPPWSTDLSLPTGASVNLSTAIPALALDMLSPHGEAVRVFSDPVPYLHAWELQSRLHEERVRNQVPDTVLILEHRPVYTLGRSTTASHWGGNAALLCEHGTELHHVNRGGSITFHGPGQIVIYPVLKLDRHATGPRQLVWLLEEIIVQLLSRWNITGHRIPGKPGIWVMTPTPEKIAFVGIRIERGVTLHGCALNVDLDVTPFHRIHPCGLSDCRIISMAAACQKAISLDLVKQELARLCRMMLKLHGPAGLDTD